MKSVLFFIILLVCSVFAGHPSSTSSSLSGSNDLNKYCTGELKPIWRETKTKIKPVLGTSRSDFIVELRTIKILQCSRPCKIKKCGKKPYIYQMDF
jgi:hypothetical protein